MTAILAAVTDVLGLVPTVFSTITGNAFFMFLLAASLVPLGVRIFKGFKRASK